eukprot:289710-Prymnesium_polylepis.1
MGTVLPAYRWYRFFSAQIFRCEWSAIHTQTPASPTVRNPAMPPKRGADELAETKEEVKKFRSALDSMADEWVCPFTFELPLDPVTAADGRTYERCAIEEHI